MKRKKNSRLRGSHTHGGGSKKKRRGAGNRGGRGRAGSGKKGDCKKPMFWKEKAKKGFHSVQKELNNPINVGDLNSLAVISKTTDFNLVEMGYSKLLGMGDTKLKMKITVNQASVSAIEKIEKAGGKVEVLAPSEEKFTEVAGETQKTAEKKEEKPEIPKKKEVSEEQEKALEEVPKQKD